LLRSPYFGGCLDSLRIPSRCPLPLSAYWSDRTARLATIKQPTLVATGEAGLDLHTRGLPSSFFERAADVIAASIPHAERQTLEGQTHVADPEVLAPVLERFFRE
jgi:pimeloyl-ACP methyl ester carboxylesterase